MLKAQRGEARRRWLYEGMIVCLLLAPCLVPGSTVGADPIPDEGSEPATEAADATAAWRGKLSIHGYLTQAFADSTGHPIFGIPTDGTADYRVVAVQLRYEMTPRDFVAVQINHEALGQSPFREAKDDIELDWAFYQHQFANGTSVKVGKVQQPYGIYNEIRDVGILLPFFRVPVSVYSEEIFASETIDGVVVSHDFDLGEAWRFKVDGYGGGWNVLESGSSGEVGEARVDRALGTQLWLETSNESLRFGLGGQRLRVVDRGPEGNEDWTDFHASIEARFGRIVFQTEFRTLDFGLSSQDAGYIHLGVNLTPRWSVHLQAEQVEFEFRGVDVDLLEDTAIGLRFDIMSSVVLKGEYHWNDGFFIEDRPRDFLPRFLSNAPFESEYGILSLSASF